MEQLPRRGDSFDLGGEQGEASVEPGEGGTELTTMLDNPERLMQVFNLDQKQVKNVRAILVAAGSGAAHKYLATLIGGPLAGAVGGFLSGLIADKIIPRR